MQNEIFNRAMQLIIQLEGTKFTDDPADHGGATRYGIIQKRYNEYRQKIGMVSRSVRLIELNEVNDIYYFEYWTKAKCDIIAEMNKENLAIYHFQAVVNFGSPEANKMLQRALGIVDDGIIGKNTLGEINKQDEFNIIYHYFKEQRAKYNRIVRHDNLKNGDKATQFKFLKGWLNRTDATLKFLNIVLTDAQRQAITIK